MSANNTLTNGRNDALSLDDYCVTNLNLGYELAASKIGSVRFGVQINQSFQYGVL